VSDEHDEQERAEALDEDVLDDVDDRTGDEFGDGLPTYPPDRPLGVGTVGLTPVEEDVGDSFAERSWREEPDTGGRGDAAADDVGQLVDSTATTVDEEAQFVGESEPGAAVSAEEAAMHVEQES
jgi:hypothetical protein